MDIRFLRIGLKILPIMSLLLLLGVAFRLSPEVWAQKSSPANTINTINTAPPVEMSQCAPCHRDLNAFENPNLINFKHEVHFKREIRCQVCHIGFPHQPQGTIKPSMEQCSNCHRLRHGNQGLVASGACNLCHPPTFNLTPQDHTADFRAKTHRNKATPSNQSCLICHEGPFCENCHARAGVKPLPEENYRFYGLWREPPPEGRVITFSGPVEMSKCEECHRDLQLWKNDKLINFNHPIHFKRGIRCQACHDEWPHQPGQTIKPEMQACARCHRLAHGNQGLTASGECSLCHPPGMPLKPDFHTPEFTSGGHKDWAKEDRSFCRMCHRQEYCDNCHRTEIPHPVGWKGEHGQVANSPDAYHDGSYACFRCHTPQGPQYSYQKAPSCAKCHKAVVFPHEQPWAPVHGEKAKVLGREGCFTCHRPALCNTCHRGVDMPHSPNWLGEHRLYLRDNPVSNCLLCHRKEQCELCHATHKVHNRHTNIFGLGR